ncbi:U3 small nucleolar ribonucleoprotein protein MPP10 [Phlebotomus argentipes]|uniref:U3 small nucleolar ribonucleoprotein protein MPP10 n=1 Tax=Phlebotomus argentipes TaxID=94469 RepID=UPI0028930817|nr:U3 small nucleolar ribonucleoprotein protein MPP10 [Phlebotomus argentipes]
MELKGVEKLLKDLDKIMNSKNNFIKGKQQDYAKLLATVKCLTDLAIDQEEGNLLSLVVDNLDQEQIFQQIDINNEAVIPQFVDKCGRILRKTLESVEEEQAVEEEQLEEEEEDQESEGEEVEQENPVEEESEEEKNDVGSEEGEEEESEGEPEAEGEENPKSTFEEVSKKLKDKISELEDEALQGRSWQMKGEITGSKRDKNNLLEEVLEFDLGARPQPQITEKTSKSLEDIIVQRIQSKCYDNVVRKVRENNETRFTKELVLDHNKSSVPLSELYEKSYLKQTGSGQEAEEEKQAPEKKEITKMLNSLFGKLDALSNFYHTLNRDGGELKIISSDPVTAEDCVVPESANDAQLMAPPEETTDAKKRKRKIFKKPDNPGGKFKRLKEDKVKRRKITDLVPLEDALKAAKRKKGK